MKSEIESLIPLIRSGKIADPEIQNITDRIKQCIKEDSSKGKEFGELLSQVRHAMKIRDLNTGLNWLALSNGFIGIGHKPGGKISFEALKKEGTTTILTLLHENEGAQLIGTQTNNAHIEWVWFPFSASKLYSKEKISEVIQLFTNLRSLLQDGAKIYIHCSAGIHRTGMITWGLLRFLGKEKTEALEMLQALREVTSSQVGEERLVWGDQFYKEH